MKNTADRDNVGISDSTWQVRAEQVGRGITLVAHRRQEYLAAAKPPEIQEEQFWACPWWQEQDGGVQTQSSVVSSWIWKLLLCVPVVFKETLLPFHEKKQKHKKIKVTALWHCFLWLVLEGTESSVTSKTKGATWRPQKWVGCGRSVAFCELWIRSGLPRVWYC